MNHTDRWRWVIAADILLHLTAIWFFAFLPPNTVNQIELTVMLLSFLAAIGVVLHAAGRGRFFGAEWAYLASGFVCVFTLLTYEIRAHGDVPSSIYIPFGLFLFAGAVSSFAAHVIDGGQKRRTHRGR